MSITLLPKLFKKTSTGAIQTWQLEVFDRGAQGFEIVATFGQLNTDKPQKSSEFITEGKNTGKKNETSAREQAIQEAEAQFKAKKKKSYVESISDAQNDVLDEVVTGGILPMLAHKFKEHFKKVSYPCYSQPKLDGSRCVAIITNGKCELYSRERNLITSAPHIIQELEAMYPGQSLVLDGELYNQDYSNRFGELMSLIRKKEPASNCTEIQYHVYDFIDNDKTFTERLNLLNLMTMTLPNGSYCKVVDTYLVLSADEVMENHDRAVAAGYEGLIVRNANTKYENKRSYNLLKVVQFDEEEFEIIGVTEGLGKSVVFSCRMQSGQTFEAAMAGNKELNQKYLQDESLWRGHKISIRFRGLTDATGSPRFPVAKAIRYEM